MLPRWWNAHSLLLTALYFFSIFPSFLFHCPSIPLHNHVLLIFQRPHGYALWRILFLWGKKKTKNFTCEPIDFTKSSLPLARNIRTVKHATTHCNTHCTTHCNANIPMSQSTLTRARGRWHRIFAPCPNL